MPAIFEVLPWIYTGLWGVEDRVVRLGQAHANGAHILDREVITLTAVAFNCLRLNMLVNHDLHLLFLSFLLLRRRRLDFDLSRLRRSVCVLKLAPDLPQSSRNSHLFPG